MQGFLGLTLLMGGCESTESLNSVRVVEQSRKERPSWVDMPLGISDLKAPSDLLVHSVKGRVIDLTLGLRQAENSALIGSRSLLESNQLQRWRADSEFSKLNAADRSAILGYFHKMLEQYVNNASIRDIYFEKISDPTELTSLQDSYAIHILVQNSKKDQQVILDSLRRFCGSSHASGLRELSRREQIFSLSQYD